MATAQTPRQIALEAHKSAMLKEAKVLASSSGMFIVDKGDERILYRKTPTRVVRLGQRRDADALRSFVRRCASHK